MGFDVQHDGNKLPPGFPVWKLDFDRDGFWDLKIDFTFNKTR